MPTEPTHTDLADGDEDDREHPLRAAADRMPRRNHGTPWTEAQRQAQGYHQLKVRVGRDTIDLLDILCEAIEDEQSRLGHGDRTVSRGEALDALLRCSPDAGELAAAIRLRSKE